MSIESGTKLGPYEVQEFIGQGAMGTVYRAYHAQLERSGAVKVLQGIAVGPDAVARFRHEAQAIAQMRHPNIVNVFDFGEYDGTPYMIVEYVPGGSLAGKMKQVALDQTVALKYLRGIGAGLDYAHSLGIVHRDIKPANVLLAKDGTVVIADFGLVKLLQGSSVQSMSGVTTGTPAYMAPEQVMGHQVGPPADLYALATMAYEMLTGAIPFEGEGVLELMYAHVHREPPPPSSRNAALTPAVDAVIMRGLAKDPQKRWESCESFVVALTAALAGQPVAGVEKTIVFAPPLASMVPPRYAPQSSPSVAATVVEPLVAGAAATVMAPPAAKRRSHKWRYIAAAAALIILIPLFGLCVLAALKPTISLSSTTVHPGDALVVSGSHLPANQLGDVQLLSILHTFGFKADSSGNVSVQLIVPRDISTGDHRVRLCWSNACHVETVLHVMAPVALATPSSSAASAPTSSPSSHPTPSSGPVPSNNPSPSPKPLPTPTPPPPSPTPTTAPAPVISISNYNIKILTGTETVYGTHFSPGTTVTITFIQPPLTNKEMGTPTVSSSGSFSLTFTVPATAALGPAQIKVCGTAGCLSATANVNAG
ncbi:MAG TPA: serine/threonine-protein kinase [Candidatus Dormibacteraeota bacterium]|nr:serine/threonine-protein kinase [Candidatus Dormibacteraeota bacterium]